VRKFYFSLLFISIFSGLLVAWQWRSNMATVAQAEQDPDLIDIIHALEKEDTSLENTIAGLRGQIEELQKNRARGESRLAALQQELDPLKLLAGLVPVTGPGVIVTLDDNNAGAQAAKNSSPTYNPENYIIHDKNVLYLVNELRAAGAEAIAVNDQRIVNSSDIRCVGTVILVNSTRLAPPYEIRAIGNPEVLETAVQQSLDFAYLKSRGFPVKVSRPPSLNLPAYKGGLRHDYARLPQSGGDE
jgi:uncharacterized protein YlxW (UPF0749 family)